MCPVIRINTTTAGKLQDLLSLMEEKGYICTFKAHRKLVSAFLQNRSYIVQSFFVLLSNSFPLTLSGLHTNLSKRRDQQQPGLFAQTLLHSLWFRLVERLLLLGSFCATRKYNVFCNFYCHYKLQDSRSFTTNWLQCLHATRQTPSIGGFQ